MTAAVPGRTRGAAVSRPRASWLGALVLALLMLVPGFARAHVHADGAATAACSACLVAQHAPAEVPALVVAPAPLVDDTPLRATPARAPRVVARVSVSVRGPPALRPA